MCGICGVWGKQDFLEEKSVRVAVEAMNESQKNRGPDDSGSSFDVFGDYFLALGHRRLSILDLSAAGNQPMLWQCQKSNGFLKIVFNGEIYNFLDLRRELSAKGFSFKTQTDTEVILALFESEGEEAFLKLRGMFAFALWDGRNKSFYLVRDRFGVKPLYWAKKGDFLVFASTVKAIAKSKLMPLSRNDDAWLAFLLFGSVPLPMTTWQEIKAIPAGCFLRVNSEGKKLERYYSSLPFFMNAKEDSSERIGKILEDSVTGHLISDAPLGVFLSGGLDSSAIAVLAAINRRQPITTISIYFDEKDFSEEKYQLAVAKKISSRHISIKLTKKDFLEGLSSAFAAMDQPTVDGLNTYFIARAAREAGVKVVLSGLGSDEIFLGYPNFRRARRLRLISRWSLFSCLGFLGGRYKKMAFLKVGGILGFYLVFRGIFSPAEAAALSGVTEKEVFDFLSRLENNIFGADRPILEAMDPIQLLSYLETKLYMQNQLLKDSDFMAMAHSVEIRVPFVDNLVIEHVAGIVPEVKLRGKFNKQLLIDALADKLPPVVYERRKMGFSFPFQQWLASVPEYSRLSSNGHWSKNWALFIRENFPKF